ncbi:MAG: Branched-chain alpha-keto acid dehydrogenase, E1 component, alpha subunit, partial [uncultured Gemmatimonadetes bacterium]
VPAGAAHPLAGREAGNALQAEQGGGRPIPLAGPGGRVGGQRLRPAPPHGRHRRHAVAADPQPGLHDHGGRHAGRGGAAVHGQGRLAGARQGAEHPLHGLPARLHRADLAAGRPGAGDGGGHAHLQAARPGPGGDGVHRRRRHLHRRLPRGDQLRRRAALPAGGDRGGKPVGLHHPHPPADGRRVVRGQGARLRRGRREGGRQRHAGRLWRRKEGRGPRARRRGRHPDRGGDLPPQGPRAARQPELRGPGRDRPVGHLQRPHRPLRGGAHGERVGHRGRAARHRRRDRRGAGRHHRRSREVAPPGAPGGAYRRVRRRARARPLDAPHPRRPYPGL